jgi:hypothetical protein
VPKGVYKRGGTAVQLKPMPVPPMPSRHGKWRAATRKLWASWFTSGRASLLDDAGMVGLERLMRIADDADRRGWPQELAREVRLTEARLVESATARGVPHDASDEDRRAARREERAEATRRRRAAAEAVGLALDEWDVLVLDRESYTPEQRRAWDEFQKVQPYPNCLYGGATQ